MDPKLCLGLSCNSSLLQLNAAFGNVYSDGDVSGCLLENDSMVKVKKAVSSGGVKVFEGFIEEKREQKSLILILATVKLSEIHG